MANRKTNDPLIGHVVGGNYRITSVLGRGGMGTVYEAEHTSLPTKFAIKTLHHHDVHNEKLAARIEREARAACSVKHHHIVRVFDLGTLEDGRVYIVMEHLEGREWEEDFEGGVKQPVGPLLHVVSQVLEGLGAAHEAGVIHRDMKPANVFLTDYMGNPSFVKILDFGVSKVVLEQEDQQLTVPGHTVGTSYYSSPEQACGEKSVDHRTDIWAVGVILYRGLTGEFPFRGNNPYMTQDAIVRNPTPSLLALRSDVPTGLEEIVNRALSKDPEDRFQSCAEMQEALSPFLGVPPTAWSRRSGGSPAIRSSQPSKAAPPPAEGGGGRLALLVGGGALLLLVLAGIGYGVFFSGQGEDPPTPATAAEPGAEPSAEPSAEPGAEAGAGEGAERVRVQLRTVPPGAQLRVAGRPVSNPYDSELLRSEEPLHVEAQLEGYQTLAFELAPSAPVERELVLVRAPSGEARAGAAEEGAEGETPRSGSRRRRGRSGSRPRPTSTSSSTSGPLDPGDPLRP